MQIHEITRPPLREGALRNIARGVVGGLTGLDIPQSQASREKDAAAAAGKLRAQGYGQEAPEQSVPDAIKAVQRNPAQQQYIKGLASQWQQQAPKPEPAPAAQQNKQTNQQQTTPGAAGQQATDDQTATTNPNWRQDALKAAGVKFPQSESRRHSKSKTDWRKDALKSVGATFDTGPAPRAKPGQMPASVASSKQGKLMLKAYGKPRGGIQDIDEAPQEYYTTPGGVVGSRPLGSKPPPAPATTPAAPAGNTYKDAFLKWAGENLQTRIPGTGVSITLDQLLKPDPKDNLGKELAVQLEKALGQVVATAGDAQKNAVAVNNFLTYAVAGVTNKSQKIKQTYRRGGAAEPPQPGQAGQAIVTQQELRNKLSKEFGLSSERIDALKKQDPATKQALFKMLSGQI